VVDAVGPGVTDLAVGDPVYGFVEPGGPCSKYITLPATFVARNPQNFSLTGRRRGHGGLTAYQAVLVKARFKSGGAVFISGGSGAVGSMAVQLARYRNANPILATAGSERSAAYVTSEQGLAPEHILPYLGLFLGEYLDHRENLILMGNSGTARPIWAQPWDL